MKNNNPLHWPTWLLLGLLGLGGLRADDTPADAGKAAAPAVREEPAAPVPDTKPELTAPPDGTATPARAYLTNAPVGSKSLRLNFRDVPLEMVLNYLSEAAGYIIVLDTEVRGKVNVWSNQPVTQEEAFTILDSALSKNGYSAIRNGRTLTIVSKSGSKGKDFPVHSGSNPVDIPKTEEMVTQIIPIKYINAAQLTQNLTQLMSDTATMTANEAGNALVITDTQINIHRIAEIIRALDTSSAGMTTIKVFPLRFADAKELAAVIKELFPSQAAGNAGGNNNNGGGGRFGGGGGFPGAGGGQGGAGGFGQGAGGGNRGGAGGNTRASASRVTAVADEHSNSLVVNAPDDVMPSIEELVQNVDTNVQDVTELRVFRLRYADPSEMADVLSGLFPDETKSNDTSRTQVRFGGGPFGGFGGGNNNAAAASSDRAKKKGKVLAIPDLRTSSVIVSAARDLMGQIGAMIEQLDSNPARKQKVYVYDLENADPTQVQEVLKTLFESQQNSRNTQRSSATTTSALNTRATQNQNNNNRSTTSGFGSGTGGGGGGGGTGRGN